LNTVEEMYKGKVGFSLVYNTFVPCPFRGIFNVQMKREREGGDARGKEMRVNWRVTVVNNTIFITCAIYSYRIQLS